MTIQISMQSLTLLALVLILFAVVMHRMGKQRGIKLQQEAEARKVAGDKLIREMQAEVIPTLTKGAAEVGVGLLGAIVKGSLEAKGLEIDLKAEALLAEKGFVFLGLGSSSSTPLEQNYYAKPGTAAIAVPLTNGTYLRCEVPEQLLEESPRFRTAYFNAICKQLDPAASVKNHHPQFRYITNSSAFGLVGRWARA